MNKQKVDQGMSIIESIIIFIIFVLGGALLLTVFFAFKELNIQFLKEYTILIGEISISIFLLMKICSIKNYSIKLNYKINFKNYIYIFFLLIGEMLVASNIYLLLNETDLSFLTFSFNEFLISFIDIVLIAAIFEEVFFRGIILKQLTIRYNFKIGLFISSILFAIVHTFFYQSVQTFFVGLLYGYIYYKTKSLILVIFMHAIWNFYWLLFEYDLLPYGDFIIDKIKLEFSLAQALLGIILILGTCFLIDKENNVQW